MRLSVGVVYDSLEGRFFDYRENQVNDLIAHLKKCDLLVGLEVKAIWNFAPTQLTAPDDVIVRNENMAVGLALLSHYLKKEKLRRLSPGPDGRR